MNESANILAILLVKSEEKGSDRMWLMCHKSLVYIRSLAHIDTCEESSPGTELLRKHDLLWTSGLASFGGTALLLSAQVQAYKDT